MHVFLIYKKRSVSVRASSCSCVGNLQSPALTFIIIIYFFYNFEKEAHNMPLLLTIIRYLYAFDACLPFSFVVGVVLGAQTQVRVRKGNVCFMLSIGNN